MGYVAFHKKRSAQVLKKFVARNLSRYSLPLPVRKRRSCAYRYLLAERVPRSKQQCTVAREQNDAPRLFKDGNTFLRMGITLTSPRYSS